MKFVTIEPAKKKPESVTEEAWRAIKKRGAFRTAFINAKECIRNTKGAYQIRAEEVETVQVVAPALENMDDASLKRLYIQTMAAAGKQLGKRVKRDDMIKLIKNIEDSLEVVADDEE